MINSVDPNRKITYGAVKDVVPQNVNAKLPQGVQNYDPKEQVDNSVVGSISGGIMDTEGLKPWQIALSVVGAIGVVFGGSAILRKLVKNNQVFKMGEKLDDVYNALKKTKTGTKLGEFKNFFSDKIGTKFKNSSVGELFKKDASGLRPNMMRGEQTMAQTQIKGSKFEACDEITDALQGILNGGKEPTGFGKVVAWIRKPFLAVGEHIGYVKKGGLRFEGEEGLRNLIEQSGNGNKADELIDLLKKYNENSSDMELKFKVKDEFMPVLKDFFGINKEGNITEIMNGAKNTDFTQRICPGLTHEVNMLNAVKNMMILDGQGAKTPLGRGAQKFLLKAVEAPTNGIMSRSKIGLIMALGIYFGIVNKIQKAPKGEKVSTAADEVSSDIGAYMMLPVNASLMYGLASFKNLGLSTEQIKNYRTKLKDLNINYKEAASKVDKQGIIKEFKNLRKTTYANGKWWQKILRIPGQIMAFGLEKGPGQTKVRGFLGGALRCITMLFVLSPLLIKPIRKVTSKIFGETTEMKNEKQEKAEKKAQKQQEKELRKLQKQNPTIPMSEEELTQKLLENPAVLQKLQNDPQLLEQVSNNPELLMQMLNESQAQQAQPQQAAQVQPQVQPQVQQTPQVQAQTQPKTSYLSPSLQQKVNKPQGQVSQAQLQTQQKTNNDTKYSGPKYEYLNGIQSKNKI